jgi:hypothetical protein
MNDFERMMNHIEVKKRGNDYHVSLKGKPEIWGCGTNTVIAIGTLISDHPELFGIKINYNYE